MYDIHDLSQRSSVRLSLIPSYLALLERRNRILFEKGGRTSGHQDTQDTGCSELLCVGGTSSSRARHLLYTALHVVDLLTLLALLR